VTIDGRRLLNFCANNYLGLANHPRVRAAAQQAIDNYGVGPARCAALGRCRSTSNWSSGWRSSTPKPASPSQSGFTAVWRIIPALVGPAIDFPTN
jgi:glycine C-acetyltransferase